MYYSQIRFVSTIVGHFVDSIWCQVRHVSIAAVVPRSSFEEAFRSRNICEIRFIEITFVIARGSGGGRLNGRSLFPVAIIFAVCAGIPLKPMHLECVFLYGVLHRLHEALSL